MMNKNKKNKFEIVKTKLIILNIFIFHPLISLCPIFLYFILLKNFLNQIKSYLFISLTQLIKN